MAGTGTSLVERANAAEPPIAIAHDRLPASPWPDHTPSHRSAERQRIIASIVEHHVVPRLAPSRTVGLLQGAMWNPACRAITNAAPALQQADAVKELSALVVHGDLSRALALVDAARGRGNSLRLLYLDLLAPTARYLGYLWDTDEMSSPSVAIGVGRLHQILRALGGLAPIAATPIEQPRRALLVAPPGAQHTFGLAMVQELFRLAAWNVWSGAPADDCELGTMVRQNWFGVVGFSVGCADHLNAVRTSIGKVRRASRNRRIGIMVGGPAFMGHPEYVAQVGADAVAGDGVEAVSQANRLLLAAAPLV